ncbi:MAG: hypothetical protein EOP88_16130, partial [Verrucomicrobiaceae bacterium]
MRPQPHLSAWLLSFGLALPAVLPMARAATLHWDGTSTGPNADGGNGNWNTSLSNTNWDTAATAGTDVSWTETHDAVFGGVGGTVSLTSSVSVGSMEFKNVSYTLTGGLINFPDSVPPATRVISSGTMGVTIASIITGPGRLSKTGSGMLTLSSPHNSFTGDLTIRQGTVRAGSSVALGNTLGSTIITDGGALDLDGRNIGIEPVVIQGTGVQGAGAIVSYHQTEIGNLRSLQLAGATTVGGSGRWSIGSPGTFIMGGHTLTKVGSGSVYLLNSNITTPGKIDIQKGSFWLETGGRLRGSSSNVITVRDGATLGQAGSSDNSGEHPWTVILKSGATWKAASGTTLMRDKAFWEGPVTAEKVATIDVGHSFTMTHSGPISGSGTLTKTGEGTWVLTSHNDYKGGTNVNEGRLILDPEYSSPEPATLVGSITVRSAGILELAKPGALGGLETPGVTSIIVHGGLVENTSGGSNSLKFLTLDGGVLRSSDTAHSPLATGRFTLLPDGRIRTLSADTPSYIHGRLDLAGSGQLPFEIAAGNTVHDLLVNASLTESVPGRGIDKSGEGRMILNGASLFTGPTTIHAGTLLIGGEGSLPHSPVTVHDGGRFGTATPGITLAALRAEQGSRLILPASAGSTTTITGALELAGGNFTVAPVLGDESATGTYDLATAAAITGTGTPVLDLSSAYGPTRATGSVSVVGNKLQLQLTSTGADLLWTNASAAGHPHGVWGTLYQDFSLDGNATTFQAFDSVTFDDSVAPGFHKVITFGANLAPARVTVDNSNGSYSLTSGGGLGYLVGGGSLVKKGTGQLSIEGAGSYTMTGGVTAGGGQIDFSGNTISIGKLTVENGGGLENATVHPRSIDLRSGTVTATLTGPAPWTKTTPGTVLLTGNNSLTGPGTVSEGKLIVGSVLGNTPFGILGSGPVHIASGASLSIGRFSHLNINIDNALSGSGEFGLAGTDGYSLTADNSSFSGTFSLTDARLAVSSAASVGTAAIRVTGNSSLSVSNMVLGNAIHLDPASVEYPVEHLSIRKATLAGPVTLAAGGTSIITSFGDPGVGSLAIENLISGTITGGAGPASVVFESSNLSGRSTLVLSGDSHYTGTTRIHGPGGMTKLDGSLGGSAVTVDSLAVLGGTGTIHAGGSLAFANEGGLLANLSGDPLRVEGNVDLGPSMKVRVDVANPAAVPGPIPVLEYTGTLSGDIVQVALAEPSSHRQTVFNFTPGLITLDIGRKNLVWKGDPGQLWETGGTVKRWKSADNGEEELFYKGDSVIFDDTAADASTSTSDVFVEPSAVLVENSTKQVSIGSWITGPCPITKRGSGSLVLRGINHHTGGTFIESGVLLAGQDAMGSGLVVVSSGATLAGDAEFSGPLAVQGTVDPGWSLEATVDTLTSGPAVLSGTYRCQLARYGSDRLHVNGDLDITGSTLAVEKDYEVTDDALEHFTLATWTGNLTGTFASVTGLPDGFEIFYDTPAKRILARARDFDSWTGDHPGLADTTPGGDPDHDGLANLLEYVLGSDPATSDSALLQSNELTEDN